ncbi:MAG: carbon storage regulator [Pyrinomonadaceae bacterium]
MLTLTRRVGEKLVVGNNIVIEVVAVSGKGVQLGIVAPRETSVHRYEVFEEIQAANLAATESAYAGHDLRASVGDIAARLLPRHSAALPAADAAHAPVPDFLLEGPDGPATTHPLD